MDKRIEGERVEITAECDGKWKGGKRNKIERERKSRQAGNADLEERHAGEDDARRESENG